MAAAPALPLKLQGFLLPGALTAVGLQFFSTSRGHKVLEGASTLTFQTGGVAVNAVQKRHYLGMVRNLQKLVQNSGMKFVDFISYILNSMIKGVPQEIRSGVTGVVVNILKMAGAAPYTVMVLTTMYFIDKMSKGELSVQSTKLFFKLANGILAAGEKGVKITFSGFYNLVTMFTQLCALVWQSGGKYSVIRAVNWATGYSKLLSKTNNPEKIKTTQDIIHQLAKIERNKTASIRNNISEIPKVQQVSQVTAVKVKTPPINLGVKNDESIEEIQIKLEMRKEIERHRGVMQKLYLEMPSSSSPLSTTKKLKIKKMELAEQKKHESIMNSLLEKLKKLRMIKAKTPHVIPTIPTKKQTASVEKLIDIINNKVEKNSRTANKKNVGTSPMTPSPAKSVKHGQKAANLIRLTLKKKSVRRRVHWASDVV